MTDQVSQTSTPSRKPENRLPNLNFFKMKRYLAFMMYPNTIYHMFNRGNQRQQIFLQERNYMYFLEKTRRTFINDIDLIAFCLMPNHFHFMVVTAEDFKYRPFSNRLAVLLRSYTRGIQNQQKFVGSLFQQNTKKKELPTVDDALNCFQYIHQNPLRANLVDSFEQWEYSSFNEYLFSSPAFCNVDLGRKLLRLPSQKERFYNQSVNAIKNPES